MLQSCKSKLVVEKLLPYFQEEADHLVVIHIDNAFLIVDSQFKTNETRMKILKKIAALENEKKVITQQGKKPPEWMDNYLQIYKQRIYGNQPSK